MTTDDNSSGTESEMSEPGLMIGDKFVPTSQLEGVEQALHTFQAQQEAANSAWWYMNPLHLCESALTQLHMTGCPWWATIVVATVMTRTLMLPLAIRAMRATGWMGELSKEFAPKLQEKRDPYAKQQIQQDMYKTMRSRGLSPWSSFAPMLMQFPILITYFLTLRSMAESVPSLQDGGVLWFVNLAETDPYFRLPLISTLIMYCNLEYSWSKALQLSGNPVHWGMKAFGRAMTIFAAFVTAAFPQAIHLYWITSNLFSFTQTVVTSDIRVRKALGFVIPKETTQTVQHVQTFHTVKGGKAAKNESK